VHVLYFGNYFGTYQSLSLPKDKYLCIGSNGFFQSLTRGTFQVKQSKLKIYPNFFHKFSFKFKVKILHIKIFQIENTFFCKIGKNLSVFLNLSQFLSIFYQIWIYWLVLHRMYLTLYFYKSKRSSFKWKHFAKEQIKKKNVCSIHQRRQI
jgi:hypothetical protein